MSFKLMHVAASETRKLAKVGCRKHSKKRDPKNTTPVINMLQKKGPEKWSLSGRLMLFRVSISAWSPGWPRGGSLAQKHLKMESQT